MLIIFTRYPTPGATKTRLIPALGAAGAAKLHRQMTERVLKQARALRQQLEIEIAVHYDGGDLQQMVDWLGTDLSYQSQGEGDLGLRMARSISTACESGSDRVVLIGTDCPDITTELLAQAFADLQTRDLVLGAAVDGGYYLIGMCRPQPELFTGIEWSSERVWQQTIEIATKLNLSISLAPKLADIDRPEDLALILGRGWQVKISIVIPAINEAKSIATVLTQIGDLPNVEVIVVDGGSDDDTISIAQGFGINVISSPPGRARQMNAGAKAATGDILLFLHADTILPFGFEKMVRSTLEPPAQGDPPPPVAGAFTLKIDDPLPSLRSIERLVAWRSQWRQMPYGDQAIFLTAATFWELGGFTQMPIMEDFELMRRLQRQGRIEILPAPVVTSARRWRKRGVWQTTFINQAIVVAYLLGVSPDRLADWYRRG
jgi:uncharacterized protein